MHFSLEIEHPATHVKTHNFKINNLVIQTNEKIKENKLNPLSIFQKFGKWKKSSRYPDSDVKLLV